ncbi:SpoIID/LytB domain-containing protein [Paenibacillus sp. DMB20]|uniref:SpoIID/LytB domain-containing protein n=1 Tax=Paenibacillus sp. DMB20 TaxID=1642570 RepID=UPI0006278D3D|nr:SpoIID/LytB domain-containing protein [Paenibacillus sp. DMB20]KKO53847.1 sporulation protein [Paenibacillus sp. DMB20]
MLAAVLACSVWQAPAVYAASPDTIRVAMFLDLGSKYRSTTPVVTIKSDEALNGTLIASGGSQQMISIPAGAQFRFSVDSYRVKVLETKDWKTASEAAKKLEATADKPLLYTTTTSTGKIYQLYSGMYATEQAAKEGAARTAKAAAAYLNGQTPAAKGALHLSAGEFDSEAAAENVRRTFADAGIDAFNVLIPAGAGVKYAVWIGEASNAAELAAVTAAAKAVSLTPLNEIGKETAGLLIRQDAGLNLAQEQPLTHYVVSGTGTKLWVEGTGAGILVKERSERTYRGAVEIGTKNGQLYLVNELPLEQYLYSVVGAEVPSSWGAEALKAQAVAARSYALFQGNKFEVAHVVDTVLSQAYTGVGSEKGSITQAVNATQGEVLMSNNKVVEAVFSSNSGGMTADPSEVWNSANGLFAAVESPGDASSQASLKAWYHVLLPNGAVGYVREDNVKETGATGAGLKTMTVTANATNIRPLPLIQSMAKPVAQMNPGETAVILEKVKESNSYEWVRGPFTSAELLQSLKGKTSTALPSEISTLEVTERGPSGRAVKVKANGQILDVKYPDLFRSALNGLPSTMFDIEPTGSYTVLGASGETSTVSGSRNVSVISAGGVHESSGAGSVIMNGNGSARVVDKEPGFKFTGKGNGHGLGLSQWGAKGMADEGYDYKKILQHYYRNSIIVKD